MSAANSGFDRFSPLRSSSQFSLQGTQANMDQTIAVSTALPANFPMPFFGYFAFTPAAAATLTLPTAWYPATRVLIVVNTNSTIARSATSTYTINGGASFTFGTAGTYLLLSIDVNQYGTVQIA